MSSSQHLGNGDSNQLSFNSQLNGRQSPTTKTSSSVAHARKTTIDETYAFSGIVHIFDHHADGVLRIRFAHNDPTRIAMASSDGSLSVCRINPSCTAGVLSVLKGHHGPVNDLAWSVANAFILTASKDGTACLWSVEQATCARVYQAREINVGEVLACEFQPINNNMFVVGGSRGYIQMMNLSTGKSMKIGRDHLGDCVTAVTFETSTGECLWAGNSVGVIQAYRCEPSTGRLTRTHRLNVTPFGRKKCPVTSLQMRTWLRREARDPCLLVNAGLDALLLFRVVSPEGRLELRGQFTVAHSVHPIRSCFFPLISLGQGAGVATGSEDTRVYIYDVSASTEKKCLTMLQGHAAPVLDVAISCDERSLVSCDSTGLVIVWSRLRDTEWV